VNNNSSAYYETHTHTTRHHRHLTLPWETIDIYNIIIMGGIESDHEVKHSHEYRALTTYLSNKPQPLNNALETFCRPTEDAFMSSQSASEVESQLWRVWKAVIATATQTPHDSPAQQKLADFVLELRNRPVLERQGQVCKVWEAVVWKDLPIFGPQMREAWNDGEPLLYLRFDETHY
jgi:hypothetical protein